MDLTSDSWLEPDPDALWGHCVDRDGVTGSSFQSTADQNSNKCCVQNNPNCSQTQNGSWFNIDLVYPAII